MFAWMQLSGNLCFHSPDRKCDAACNGYSEMIHHRIKKLIVSFKTLQGNPPYLARGTAIGVFVGVAPILPFKTLLIVSMTFLLPSSTVAAILVCTLICNPLTYIPLYYAAWCVGNLLLPGYASWEKIQTSILLIQQSGFRESLLLLGQTGAETMVVIVLGGVVLAVPFTVVSYPLSLRFFTKIAQKRQEKHLLNRR